MGDLETRIEDAKEEGLWFVCIAPINTAALSDTYALVQARGEQVEMVVFHPIDYADILKLGDPKYGLVSAALTTEETSEMQRTGEYPGKLWGAEMVVTLEGTEPGYVEVRGPTVVAYLSVCR